jgi:Ni/Co efflux regulator RcnB
MQQPVQPQFQRQAPVQQQFQQPPVQQQAQPQFQQHAQPQVQQQYSQPGTAGSSLRPSPGVAGSFHAGGPPVRDPQAGTFSYHGQAYAPFRAGPYRWPNGMSYRRYGIGAYLPLGFIVSAYVLADWIDYGLAPPPPGNEWVRYGPDVLLVDPSTGQIVDGAYSAFAESDEQPPPAYGQYGPATQPYSPPPGYAAQLPPAGGPQNLGNFGNWSAAAYQENGQPVCYASTQAVASTPQVPGRAPPILTVTERVTGRDAVSIGGIVADAGNGGIMLQVGHAALDFYPAAAAAFAGNGAAAVVAFRVAGQAVVQTMSPYNGPITDSFSLMGFSAAYAAISAACPRR